MKINGETIKIEQLYQTLDIFYSSVQLGVHAINDSGETICSRGNSESVCGLYYLKNDARCPEQLLNSSQKAFETGEAYIFECKNNLTRIVFPIVSNNVFFGAVATEPFIMTEPDDLINDELLFNGKKNGKENRKENRKEIEKEAAIKFYSKLPIISPSRVRYIGLLMEKIFRGLVTDDNQTLNDKKLKMMQQSDINENVQQIKSSDYKIYPYEKEQILITKVKTGNKNDAFQILNELLGYVLFSGGANVDKMKARAFELCTLLSRAAVEGGASINNTLAFNIQIIESLKKATNIDDLCFTLKKATEYFTESVFVVKETKNSGVIKKAAKYIHENYSKNVTLEDVANCVHLNSAYFSTLFKKETGISFKEYINKIRIAESKYLLTNSMLSIVEIAIGVGFEDQSYYTKVFKKIVGVTPKQYRTRKTNQKE